MKNVLTVVVWSMLHGAEHPAIKGRDHLTNLTAAAEVASELFPGIDYSLSHHGDGVMLSREGLRVLFPTLVEADADSVGSMDTVNIQPILPCKGNEWEHNKTWKKAFREALEQLEQPTT